MLFQKNFDFVGLNIVPNDWNYVGHRFTFSFDDGYGGKDAETDFEFEGSDEDSDTARLLGSTIECNICNHKVKNLMFFKNNITGQLLACGCDCGSNVLNYRFDVVGAKRQTLRERKLREKQNRILKVFSENPELENYFTNIQNKIVKEIGLKFKESGYISEKQIEFVKKLSEQRIEFESKSEKAPIGKFEGEFTILSASYKRVPKFGGSYGRDVSSDIAIYFLLQHKSGWKLWYKAFTFWPCGSWSNGSYVSEQTLGEFGKMINVNLTSNTDSGNNTYYRYTFEDVNEALQSLKGKRVEVRTTISVGNDPYFGVAKRVFDLKSIK